jgi:hypothetical protein
MTSRQDGGQAREGAAMRHLLCGGLLALLGGCATGNQARSATATAGPARCSLDSE